MGHDSAAHLLQEACKRGAGARVGEDSLERGLISQQLDVQCGKQRHIFLDQLVEPASRHHEQRCPGSGSSVGRVSNAPRHQECPLAKRLPGRHHALHLAAPAVLATACCSLP